MADFDLIVLGGGTGNVVASAAAEEGRDVAIVERGRLGGTCLNRGCNPSKKLIHRADVVRTVREAGSFGIEASLSDVAFGDIVEEVTTEVTREAEEMAQRAREHDRITLYRAEGRFVDERTVEVDPGWTSGNGRGRGDEVEAIGDGGRGEGRGERDERDGVECGDGVTIEGERVVLAGGSRPMVPDSIDGTNEVEFLTSDEALRLTELPDRLAVVGGGYVAVEMAHFFGAMGAEVAIVGRGDVLADREDREVAERLTEAYVRRHELYLEYEATALERDGDETVVVAEPVDGDSDDDSEDDDHVDDESDEEDRMEVRADEVLIAAGRQPNSDLWDVDAAGIETDDRGFVRTDEYLATSVDGVWAIGDIARQSLAGSRTSSGDIAGDHMFKHSGDKEAEYVVENAIRGNRKPVEYPGMAHAIFGSPQVASLGRTAGELEEEDRAYEVGTCEYDETVMGSAIGADDGFAKVLVGSDGEILGFHVVGPQASTLVHEVSVAVAAGADAERVAETIHVHPALSEVVQAAFRDVRGVAPTGI